VANRQVGLFDPAHVLLACQYVELRQGAELAAVAARQRQSAAADRIGVFDRPQYVRGIPRPADPHHQVAGLGEVLQLLDEDVILADVVRVRGDRGDGIGQRHDAEAGGAAVAGALQDVRDEVGGRRRAAAVAAYQNRTALRAGLSEPLDRLSRSIVSSAARTRAR